MLAGPTSGEMVYMVPRPGTWYINNKGDLVLKPQSKWVNDPTAKSGRKVGSGFHLLHGSSRRGAGARPTRISSARRSRLI